MELLASIFLFLHIGGAIAAFGPTVAFPIIGAMAAGEPMHGNFALRLNERIASRVVTPGAIFVFLMGIGLIWTRGWNLFTPWLAIAIILFLIALGYSIFVQLPTVKRMVERTSGPPPAAVEGSGPPAGPPPEFVALTKRAAMGGQLTGLLILAILFLMVFKPFS